MYDFSKLKVTASKMSLEGKTSVEFAQEVCEMTFLGKSKIPLSKLYRSEHSPVRTQIFWVTFENIPLFISTHLLRHHVGSTPFQLTCRDDRKGANVNLKAKLRHFAEKSSFFGVNEDDISQLYNEIDRYTPVNLGLLINAQALMDMAKLRECNQSHKETIYVFKELVKAIGKVDEDLPKFMVPKCIYRGGICGEPMACGWNKTKAFKAELKKYLANFDDKQLSKELLLNTQNEKQI